MAEGRNCSQAESTVLRQGNSKCKTLIWAMLGSFEEEQGTKMAEADRKSGGDRVSSC